MQTAHLEALKILLSERDVDLQALHRLVIMDLEAVAPTPVTSVPMARSGNTARTLEYRLNSHGPKTPETVNGVCPGIVTPSRGIPMHPDISDSREVWIEERI